MSRFFNIACVLCIALAMVQLYLGSQRKTKVKSEFDRLSEQYGELNVKDPTKYLVVNVDTNDPYYFYWRVYQPQLDTGLCQRSEFISGGTGSMTPGPHKAREVTASFRFRIIDGQLNVFSSVGPTSTLRRFDIPRDTFLIENWSSLEFKLLAQEGAVEIAADEILRLLTIVVPEHLHKELPDSQPNIRLKQGVLLESLIGSASAFKQANIPR